MKWFTDGDQLCITTDFFINLQESPAAFIPLNGETAQALLTNPAFLPPFEWHNGIYRAMWEQLKRGNKKHCPNWKMPFGPCHKCDYCEIAGWIL